MKQESFSDMEYRSRKRKTKRDPEMHAVKKGNQWHFGMKCHTGVDAGSGFVHTVEATAANVHDVTVAARLLREDDKAVCGDSACLGIEKREEIKSDPQLSAIEYRINFKKVTSRREMLSEMGVT